MLDGLSRVSAGPTPIDIARSFLDRVPVDLHGLADRLGIEVDYHHRFDDPTISGSIQRIAEGKQPRYRIRVNGSDSDVRKRFTLAHEISHFLLHRSKLDGDELIDSAMYRSGLPEYEEYQANQMAAELLMPRHAVKGMWDAGIRSIHLLAQNFKASEPAVRIRLKQLGLAP